MSYPYLAYFNDEPVGIVPLSGRFSEDRKDKIHGAVMVANAMGFDTRISYLMHLPGYSLEENPLKEYDTDTVFLSLKNVVGRHTMQVNFDCYALESIARAIYDDAKDWNEVMFYVRPKEEEINEVLSKDGLWFCSDWEG